MAARQYQPHHTVPMATTTPMPLSFFDEIFDDVFPSDIFIDEVKHSKDKTSGKGKDKNKKKTKSKGKNKGMYTTVGQRNYFTAGLKMWNISQEFIMGGIPQFND